MVHLDRRMAMMAMIAMATSNSTRVNADFFIGGGKDGDGIKNLTGILREITPEYVRVGARILAEGKPRMNRMNANPARRIEGNEGRDT